MGKTGDKKFPGEVEKVSKGVVMSLLMLCAMLIIGMLIIAFLYN